MSNEIDYKGNTILLLFSMVKDFPQYTTAELFKTIFSPKNLKRMLLECSDEDVYAAVERARNILEEDENQDIILTNEEWELYIQSKFN
jgi:hypothetical protein